MNARNSTNLFSSFRDPSGFVFKKGGVFYRQVNYSYQAEYNQLMDSGLFKTLVNNGLLINHRETNDVKSRNAYKILLSNQIQFISYPYEWCFSQYKDAALATLEIQQIALEKDMSLKDASAYNIQFMDGRPILIDTLSFERYEEGKPWVAYRQFCQHFLAPLALMSQTDFRLGILSLIYLAGIPLDLTVRLLPLKTRLSLGLGTHLHLHARSQRKHADVVRVQKPEYSLSKKRLMGILDNLRSTVSALRLPKQETVWQDYYDKTNYTAEALSHKEKILQEWINKIGPKIVWDAGSNNGRFSQLSSKKGIFTIATDFDPIVVEYCYSRVKKNHDKFLLPLIIDLTNPTPAIGWENQERTSFLERASFDLTLCLALIHHLAIVNNLPFSYIANLFVNHSKYLAIEFVPKNDSNAQRLLANRKDIFDGYTEDNFTKEFSRYFTIRERIPIQKSCRILYLLKKKGGNSRS